MWKPYNCSVAQKEQIETLARKALLYLSIRNLKDLLWYIISAITIVAFLLAVDYFSAKPSLRISIYTRNMGYYIDSLLYYYQANNISFPKQLMEDQSLRKLFTRDTPMDPNQVYITGWLSDEALIGAIVRGQEIGSFVEYRIEQLERQIGKYTYTKQIYGYVDDRGFYDEQKFRPILDYIKSKLSTNDYYIFLASLIHSREVNQTIFITNDGDLNLKNVRMTLPSPFSKVSDSRSNNILSCRPDTSLLHEVVYGTSEITLRLPSFKKGESLSLNIRTRENEINKSEVFTSYEQENIIDRSRVILYFFLILIIMFFLNIGLKILIKERGN